MAEHSEQVSASIGAQKPQKKGRTAEQKVGRLKYNQMLLKKILAILEHLEQDSRIIKRGLSGAGYFHFSIPMIQRVACVDRSIDLEPSILTAGL